MRNSFYLFLFFAYIYSGYLYDYEFLDSSGGIEVEDGKIVKPLFKHFISIHYPTMCFLGLLQKTIILPLLDLQVCIFDCTQYYEFRQSPENIMWLLNKLAPVKCEAFNTKNLCRCVQKGKESQFSILT